MCKVLIMTRHNKAQRDDIIKKAWAYFARSGERDGYGAAWLTADGKIAHRHSSVPGISRFALPSWFEHFADGAHTDEASDGGFLIIHGRTATCGKSLNKTHPMLSARSALIHNGVVRSALIKNETTTCDSELILRALEAEGPAGLSKISGYLAIGVIETKPDAAPVLHVARDASASLLCARIKGGWAFATTADALEIAKPVGPMSSLVAYSFLTFTGPRDCMNATFSKAPDDTRLNSLATRAGIQGRVDWTDARDEYWQRLEGRGVTTPKPQTTHVSFPSKKGRKRKDPKEIQTLAELQDEIMAEDGMSPADALELAEEIRQAEVEDAQFELEYSKHGFPNRALPE